MPQDFIAKQIRASQIIATGSALNSSLAIYGAGSATNFVGGTTFPGGAFGSDTFLFISGSINSKGVSGSNGTTVMGGDSFISGSLDALGSVTLGSVSPSVTTIKFLGRMDSNILPNINKNFTLGTNALQWKEVHSSTGSFDFLNVAERGVFPSQLSGSLQQTSAGLSYLVAGSGVSISTGSNGQITISSTGGGAGSGNWNELTPSPRLNTTGSVSIAGGLGSSYAAQSAGSDVFFFVSGTKGDLTTKGTSLGLFGGDVATSGSALFLSDTGFALASLSSNDFYVRNRVLGGTFVASVNTTIGNTVNFLDVRPNGAATNTKIAFMQGVYAGPSNPFTSTDTNFFVGGSRSSKGGSAGGTSVFGGDLMISGSTYLGTAGSDVVVFRSDIASDIIPDGNVTRNLGSPVRRFANIYTGDLHLKNDRGDYTLIEEEDCLTIRFNKTGKRYRFVLEPAPEFDEK